jgi:hypothetical protein
MISNMDTYLSIARESHSEMERLFNAARSPKPDGSPGYIITYDPNSGSFKQALITIAFSAMYFEALTYFTARKRFSKTKAADICGMWYENRLEPLGITDKPLTDRAKLFRLARNDLIHEKAIIPSELGSSTIRFAQQTANESIEFVLTVRSQLGAP